MNTRSWPAYYRNALRKELKLHAKGTPPEHPCWRLHLGCR